MITSQNQKGGDSSTNIQAQQMVLNVGIDEKRAREIYQEMNSQLRLEYTTEAFSIACNRVAEFENRLMPKMAQVEGALGAFADPSFQLLLVEAQKRAASTERLEDYDLLSELLMHRFQKGEDRIVRASINFAVEIVDNISDEALLGLTVAHAVSFFAPLSENVHEGLDVLNNLFGKLFYAKLPRGHDWLDHLDILKATRLNPIGNLRKVQDFYPEVLHGYVDVGIEKGSEASQKADEIMKSNNLPAATLIESALNSNFRRLPIRHKNTVESLTLIHHEVHEGKPIQINIPLTEEQIEAIRSIYNLYSKDENLKQDNIKLFMLEWDKRPNLKKLREWWDNIAVSFTITSVGKTLAHCNAQRCDNTLPPL